MRKEAAFSLVEVTLALGIIAFAFIAILGMIPVGLTASREAAESVATSLIAQDAFTKVQAKLNTESAFTTFNVSLSGTPPKDYVFFYNTDGGYITDGNDVSKLRSSTQFRAEISGGNMASYPPNISSDVLKCVTVRISWPINTSTGAALGAGNPKATYSFYLRKQ